MLLVVAEVDALLRSIDIFVSEDCGVTKAPGKGLAEADVQRMSDFLESSPALGRAFELELMSCQRLVKIIFPPYIKLAHAYSSASSQRANPASSQREPLDAAVFKLLDVLCRLWGSLLIKNLSGEEFPDRQGHLHPVIGPKKRAELVDGFLMAKVPEVRVVEASCQGN